ncbi:MAG: glycosyltransferase family 2 protein [Natronohydrobacter sp.]|nr:glycosyltransferase family 2 protein [Natronohydrobacter sp.]
MTPVLSVLIPASNEERYIGPCLKAVLSSDPVPGYTIEVIVIANGCNDDTVGVARRFRDMAEGRGWRLSVLDLYEGGKIGALNAGDEKAIGRLRVYLDADVTVSPPLLAELALALSKPGARYATGTPEIAPAVSLATRIYGRFWARVPFMREGAPGFGIYAVNTDGRSRWAEFPGIISDDTFVRLNFTPAERVQLRATYRWPLVEGFGNLVRVRRRQDQGVAQIKQLFPELAKNDTKSRADLPALLRADPIGFVVYTSVAVLVRLGGLRPGAWTRGR